MFSVDNRCIECLQIITSIIKGTLSANVGQRFSEYVVYSHYIETWWTMNTHYEDVWKSSCSQTVKLYNYGVSDALYLLEWVTFQTHRVGLI